MAGQQARQLSAQPLGGNVLKRASRLVGALLATISCAHPPAEVNVRGELLFDSRYIQLCDEDTHYALVFPSEVAFELKRKLDDVDPEHDRIVVAEFRGPLYPPPAETSASATLAVFYILSLDTGGCR